MRKHFKLLLALCTLAFVLAISATAATDFSDYTAISDADGLLALMNSESAVTGKYYLTNDIDLTGKTQSPIGEKGGKSFGTDKATAVFDGNGKTVKGVNISGGDYTGFFGVVRNCEIRNLTIEGTISTTSNYGGALVAFANPNTVVIENCVNKCTLSFTGSSSGRSCGGILGMADRPKSLTISNCTNEGQITASYEVGGIVGKIKCATGSTVLIENCVNNGKVTADSYLNVKKGNETLDASSVGGILGCYDSINSTGTPTSFKVTQCRNAAEVKGYACVGGIIGDMLGTDTSSTAYDKATFHVTECWNDGNVASDTEKYRSYTGGILGYTGMVGDVRDCLNTGNISACCNCVGGLFGGVFSSGYFFGAKNNLNRAEVLLNDVAVYNGDNTYNNNVNTYKYVNSIGGYMAYKPYGTNYYTGDLQGQVWTNGSYKSTQYNSSLFNNLNESGNWVNAAEPMLNEFKSVGCKHTNVSFTAGTDSIIFKCASCEKDLYTDITVESMVYVDATNGIAASEGKDIGTTAAPFKSLTEAFEYVAVAAELKNTNAKINIVGTVNLEDSYETPKTEKTITVTGGTLHFGGAKAANRQIYMGGPMVFENITFTSHAADTRIYAQNNKLVMGEGIVMGNATSTTKVNSSVPFAVNDVKMIVMGGFISDIPDTMATDITVRSGEYYIVGGWNYTNDATATTGTSKITVGKTDASDTLKICDLASYSIVVQTRATADITATMIIDGDADIARLIISERERTTNAVEANYTTHLVLRGAVSGGYRSANLPYGFDITGGGHTESSLGYHTFRIFTDKRVEGAVLAEHAFFGGDGYEADTTLTTGGYKPVSEGGDVTMTQHTYMEYCATYMDGHTDGDDEDTLCDECGADTACTHANAVPTVETESNCTVNGHEFTFCHECGIMVNERELPLDSGKHNYVWEAFDGGYRYVCTYNAEHVYCTYNSAVTEFYVSDGGKADGGFSASYPSNDFDAVMKLAAACDTDATVYIVGTVTLPDNDDTDYEVYIEPEHTNTITVCGYKDISGIVRMGSRNTRLEYVLSGDTTFRQIEFYTGVSKNAFYITARHNHLVMGEKITSNFARYNGDSTANSGKVIVIGGCDNTIDSSACDKEDTHITLHSGTYYMVIGGSSLKGCGLENGTINIDVLGDITVGGVVTNQNGYVDRQFILGSHSANVGDIVMVIDGNITCINALCIASYGANTDEDACYTAGDVSITIKSGSLIDYSFSGRSDSAIVYDDEFAAEYDPTAGALDTATLVIFPLGNTHSHATRGGVMKSVDNVYISYNANTYSTVNLAERFRLSLGGSDNFHMDVLPEKPCTSASGRHTPSDSGNVVLEATCRGEGSIEYTCSVCGITYAQSITRLPHEYGDEALFSEANCISPAMYVSVCENEDCGYKMYTASGTSTDTHTFENGICKYCRLSVQDLCEHESLSVAETFVSGCGVGTKQTCLECGKEFVEVDSTDHNFGKYTVTVEPTDSTPGVKSRTCRSCGKVETALLYADGSTSFSEAIATNADGSLSDVTVDSLKLTAVEKAALNALLQDTNYGSEIKVSYKTSDDVGTDIIYSIPLPAEYADMQNLKIVVKDDEGNLHSVDFEIEKGYIVFTF
ncbi:MAG: hypothetical protein IJ002_03685 [Clostridia bacterium]|nr:hypothetical protein [Clostridia bacterium]